MFLCNVEEFTTSVPFLTRNVPVLVTAPAKVNVPVPSMITAPLPPIFPVKVPEIFCPNTTCDLFVIDPCKLTVSPTSVPLVTRVPPE